MPPSSLRSRLATGIKKAAWPISLLLIAGASPLAHAQSFIQFIPTFDFGTLSAGQQTTFQATITSALNYYSTTFTTPTALTVKILFKADESISLGQSSTFYSTVSYTNFRAALATNASSAADTTALSLLPIQTNNPVNGSATVSASTPLLRALGFNANPGGVDSTVSLKTSIMNLDRTTIDNSKYDLKSVVWHEVDEVLGFGSALNGLSNGAAAPTGAIGSLDLFRYNSDGSGTRSFSTSSSANASLSINGTTLLTGFNQNAAGDFHDFIGGAQVQNAFGTPGATPNLGTAEITALDVIGYNVSAIPEPSSVALLLGLGAIGFTAFTRRRSTLE